MKLRYKLSLVLLAVFCIPMTAKASIQQTSICCEGSGLYSVTYDTSVNTEVNKNKINCNNVYLGHLDYPNGVEDTKYKFNVAVTASDCRIIGGKVISCPKDSGLFAKIKDFYFKNGSTTDNVKYSVAGNERFNISIKKHGDYTVKYYITSTGSTSETEEDVDESRFSDLTPSGSYYKLYNIEGKQKIVMEFYQKGKNDGCDGAFIGHLELPIPDPAQYEIDNPAYPANDKSDTYGCTSLKKWKPTNVGYDKEKLASAKESIVGYCYTKTIMYSELGGLKDSIVSGIKQLKQLYDIEDFISKDPSRRSLIKTVTTDPSKYVCANAHNGTSRIDTWTGKFWAYRCVENYEAHGDTAKLVRAGDGFEYQATFTLTRTCDPPIEINPPTHYKPVPQPQYCPVPAYTGVCKTSCWWKDKKGMHYNEGQTGHAGPNDDFDTCVNQCDGGKYTQSCINSCYSKTYNETRDFTFSSNFSLDERKEKNVSFTSVQLYEPVITNSGPVTITTSSGITNHNRPAIVYTMKINNPQGVAECQAKVSTNYCALGFGGCTFYVEWVVSGYNLEYCGMVAAAADAEEEFVEEAISNPEELVVDTSKFWMEILDSYSVDGKANRWIRYTADGGNGATPNTPHLNVNVVKDGGSSATVTVSLPLSYINARTGAATYRGGSASAFADYGRETFGRVTGFNEKEYFFTSGERKYYTDVHSPNTNVHVAGSSVSLVTSGYTTNIKVSSGENGNGGLGYGNHYGSTISCYYGVYNQFMELCENGEPLICDQNDVCSCGIQYIYRPIELNDAFPNGRDPRFNWSYKSIGRGNDLYNTQVDPIKYNETMASKDKKIYEVGSGEIDYEFVLTPQNIAAIQGYNRAIENNTLEPKSNYKCPSGTGKGGTDFNCDGSRNYLDYDMNCTIIDHRTVCTSNFLDDTSMVTYSGNHTAQERRDIAKCNNAKSNGTECDYSAHGGR